MTYKHHRPRPDARSAAVVDGAQGGEEGCRVRGETEDAETADYARYAQVVVVEASEPGAGGAGERGGGEDGDGAGGVGRGWWRWGGDFEAVEVEHAG